MVKGFLNTDLCFLNPDITNQAGRMAQELQELHKDLLRNEYRTYTL